MKAKLVLLALSAAAFAAPAAAQAVCQTVNNPAGGGAIIAGCVESYDNGDTTTYAVAANNASTFMGINVQHNETDVTSFDTYAWLHDYDSQNYLYNYGDIWYDSAEGQGNAWNGTYLTSYPAGRYCDAGVGVVTDDLVHGGTGSDWDCWEL